MPEEVHENPENPAGPTSRRRLWNALLHPSRGQIIVGVLLAALGYAAVTQVRVTELDNSYAGYREQDLINVLNTTTNAAQRAESEIARLEQAREDLRSNTRKRQTAIDQATQTAETLQILAGQVPVTGPGLRITITEDSGAVDIDSLLDTVQELRTAGAEAMEFNDEVRVIAQTAFADGIGGISVDGALLASPYTIDVIGDPATLEGALSFPQGPAAQLIDDGAIVEVTRVTRVQIGSVRNSNGENEATKTSK
jgi:uncharacterized protein YlxW (UPF0749 family)